jgi:hypothetical protein
MKTTQEVFESHILYILECNTESDITENYASDCTLLTNYGLFNGHNGVLSYNKFINEKLPSAEILFLNRAFCKDVAFLEWQAESPNLYVDDGVETFIIRKGVIQVQTIHFTMKIRTS